MHTNEEEQDQVKQLSTLIKSNLVTFGLSPEQIEQITEHLSKDIFDLFINTQEEQ